MQSAVISLKHTFLPGTAYVALSRLTSLKGLKLLDFEDTDIYADPRIIEASVTMKQLNLDDVMPLLHVKQTLDIYDSLTIVHHNTEGLPAHIDDLKSHHELQLADILCLTETHLKGFVATRLHLTGYRMFRRDRQDSYTDLQNLRTMDCGGVAVYVKDHIEASQIRYLNNVKDLEVLVLKVESPMKALIAVVYRPPCYNMSVFLRNLESLLDALAIIDIHPTIVLGDVNENQKPDNRQRKPIFELFRSRNFEQLITETTTDRDTLLDPIFVSKPERFLHSGVLRSYYSYHHPVYCVMSSE